MEMRVVNRVAVFPGETPLDEKMVWLSESMQLGIRQLEHVAQGMPLAVEFRVGGLSGIYGNTTGEHRVYTVSEFGQLLVAKGALIEWALREQRYISLFKRLPFDRPPQPVAVIPQPFDLNCLQAQLKGFIHEIQGVPNSIMALSRINKVLERGYFSDKKVKGR